MKKNIFLTGAPSAGKSTVIRKVVSGLKIPANGFFTEEERVNGRRIGFMMKTLDGKSGYLGHQDISSAYSVRRYGVSIENIENIAVPAIKPVSNHVIILDEIAKMECFSDVFIKAALQALDAPNTVVGTIAYGREGFIGEVKQRADVEIIEVTFEKRDSLPGLILKKVHEYQKA